MKTVLLLIAAVAIGRAIARARRKRLAPLRGPKSDAGLVRTRILHTAAVTVNRPREEVERAWQALEARWAKRRALILSDAPGGRGTELRVPHGRLAHHRTRARLRELKQRLETGEVLR